MVAAALKIFTFFGLPLHSFHHERGKIYVQRKIYIGDAHAGLWRPKGLSSLTLINPQSLGQSFVCTCIVQPTYSGFVHITIS